jgi:hypothetical protein
MSRRPDRGAPRLGRGVTNVGGFGGHFGAPNSQQVDYMGSLGYKVRVLSPFPAMETYADH